MYKNPTTLYTYWDFSKTLPDDFDNRDLGLNWNESQLSLNIINLSHKYSFYLPINDFSKQWYINFN